jgi:hypothetical protein
MAASFLPSIHKKDQVVLSADLLIFLEIIQRARPSAAAAIQSGPNSLGYAASRPVGTAMVVLIGTTAMRARPSLLRMREVAIRCSWAQAMSVPHMEHEEKFSCK